MQKVIGGSGRLLLAAFAIFCVVGCAPDEGRDALEDRLQAIEDELDKAQLDTEAQLSTPSDIAPTTSEVLITGDAESISFYVEVLRDEFWSTVGNPASRDVRFGLSGNDYLAVEVLDPTGSALWVYEDEWVLDTTFEDIYALWNENSSVRFFDATGNGIEDIVLNYQGGKRMTGNVLTKIDGSWVDTGAFQRPEYAQPGRMRITYQSCDPSCAEGDDISSWGYWTGLEWKACTDPDAPVDCNHYWTGG